MSEDTLIRSAECLESGNAQLLFGTKACVTTRKKKVAKHLLSNPSIVKRKADPKVAQEFVTHHFIHHTKHRLIPPLISRFLERHWWPYMTQLYLLEGDHSETWHKALENTQNLIWSVQPKCDDESQQRLYVLLPHLYHWVHEVLESQLVNESEEDGFFAELACLQVESLHTNASSVSLCTPNVAIEPSPNNDPTAHCVDGRGVPSGASEGFVSRYSQSQTDGTMETEGKESDFLRNLVVGVSVVFQSERATKRKLRLEWISKDGNVYFFRDHRGDTLCLTVDRCVECLRECAVSGLN